MAIEEETLKHAQNVFLAEDVDPEDIEDNRTQLIEWEKRLQRNRLMKDWKAHEISREILFKVKDAYKNFSLSLLDRRLNEQERMTLFAKIDACEFILGLVSENPDEEMGFLMREIETAIARVT